MTNEICREISDLLESEDKTTLYASTWCLAWMGYDNANLLSDDIVLKSITKLIEIWLKPNLPKKIKRTVSWAIYSCITPQLKTAELRNFSELKTAIATNFDCPQNDFDQKAAIHLAVLYGVWNNEEVKMRIAARTQKEVKQSGMIDSKFLTESGITDNQILFSGSHLRKKIS